MDGGYTKQSEQKCLDMLDTGMDSVWEDIESTDENTTVEKWLMKLQSIAEQFVCSARFGLMRILLSEAPKSELLNQENPIEGFCVNTMDGKRYQLRDITMEHAENLTREELKAYEAILQDRADSQADADRERDEELIKKALHFSKKAPVLSREEAFVLGHCLQFSYEEMQWFLLRIFETESGFRLYTSNDLIEAYGFKIGASASHVEKLKQEYEEKCGKISKAPEDHKEKNWTKSAGDFLVQADFGQEDGRDRSFMEGLQKQAPVLDTNSATALRIYRNLAAYLVTIEHSTSAPKLKDMNQNLLDIITKKTLSTDTLDLLYECGEISEQKCKKCAESLLSSNRCYLSSKQSNKAAAFHIPAVKSSGRPTLHNAQMNITNANGKIANDGRMKGKSPKTISTNRVCQILLNRNQIEKEDMLYLLWLYELICWDEYEPTNVKRRIQNFIIKAKILLGKAMLPEFYPPHMMEQSMLLSMVCAGIGYDFHTPGEIYENICDSAITHRKS